MMSPEEANEYQRLMKNRPHVVILGAGATMAAIPNGDANGKKSSVMNGFIEALGMTEIIKRIELKTSSNNLEDIYSELHGRPECDAIREELDRRIREYFSELELPSQPNIYDLLLLGLRKKDLVATFNWDPLLLQAYQRACKLTKDLPDMAFLHGNVLVGYCRSHKRGGILSARCPECGEPFQPAPLLYPVSHKDYAADPYIENSWKAVRNKLKHAYLVTVFGYSAPKTDSEAIALMKEAWGTVEERTWKTLSSLISGKKRRSSKVGKSLCTPTITRCTATFSLRAWRSILVAPPWSYSTALWNVCLPRRFESLCRA